MNNQQIIEKKPIIAIAIMIKNESTSIQGTLYSMFKAGIRDFFILDTGSTDNTIEITRKFFVQHQLNGYIHQEPFIDFSTSRNRTLELAEQHFLHIPFLLMPDADWYLRNGKALLTFCEKEKQTNCPLYGLKIKMNGIEFTTARLFRTVSRIRFKGVVHEIPAIPAEYGVPLSIYFEVNATSVGIEKSKQRWQKDLQLLLAAYRENSYDSRNVFYLAQTYECLNDVDNAYRFYQLREKLTGCDAEKFVTLLRLGQLARRIQHTDSALGWATAMDYFLKALVLRPHRIEPLLQIADYYWPENIPACYLFVSHAYDKPYPVQDQHFIDKLAYQYTRYEIMSRCAWHMGEFALGEKATLLALEAQPGTPHLLNNLNLYQQKNQSQDAP